MDQLAAISIFLLIGGGAVVLLRLLWHRGKHWDDSRRLWALAAQRLGGELRLLSGVLGGSSLLIELKVDGIAVTVSNGFGVGGGLLDPADSTIFRALAPGAEGFLLQVIPEQGLASLGKVLGVQDIVIGDETFDSRYVIKSNNEDMARLWLSDAMRRRIEQWPRYHFVISQGEVRASRAGLENDIKALGKVAEIVVRLSRVAGELLVLHEKLAKELDGHLTTTNKVWGADTLIVVKRFGSRVLVDTIRQETNGAERLYTRVRVRSLGEPVARFVLDGHLGIQPSGDLGWLPRSGDAVEDGFTLRSEDPGVRDRLSPTVLHRLRELRPAVVESGGHEVSVLLPGMTCDATVITGAAELALGLTRGENIRPYR